MFCSLCIEKADGRCLYMRARNIECFRGYDKLENKIFLLKVNGCNSWVGGGNEVGRSYYKEYTLIFCNF